MDDGGMREAEGKVLTGKPWQVMPRCEYVPSLQRSDSNTPDSSRRPMFFMPPVTESKPVAKAMMSNSRNAPSWVKIPFSLTSTTGFLLMSTMWFWGLSSCS